MRPKAQNIKLLTVARAEAGQTLQQFLARRLKLSMRQAKELLDQRKVWVNRACIWMARHILHSGDAVEVQGELAVAPNEPKPLRLLLETPHYLIVDKPVNMLSIGAGGVEERLRAQLKQPELRCVHRLDRDTSGCLLIARGREALEAAVALFKTRRVKKVYDVLCVGRLERNITTIETPLAGEAAKTHVKLLMAIQDASFARVRIETGRTHQIRLHLASIRHPVVGDRLHGLKRSRDQRLLQVPRQMLHAVELELPNPLGDGTLRAHSPLPADFRRGLRLFGLGK